MSRVVIKLFEKLRPNASTDLSHEYFMLNYPDVKEFGSKISRGDVLLLHFLVCEQIYKTSRLVIIKKTPSCINIVRKRSKVCYMNLLLNIFESTSTLLQVWLFLFMEMFIIIIFQA